MNASVVRTLVPAGAWRASSVRGGHTAHASSRAPTQTCIPTPKTKRHTPVPRADLRSISPSVPTFHRSRTAPVKGRLERETDRRIQRGLRAATTPRISVASLRKSGASAGRYASRNARPDSRLALEFELGAQGVPSRACSGSTQRSASRPELADRRSRLIRAINATCVYVPGNTATGIRAIDAALHRNLTTACAGRTMYKSSKMSNGGVSTGCPREASGSLHLLLHLGDRRRSTFLVRHDPCVHIAESVTL
jgi:hypothetical protein